MTETVHLRYISDAHIKVVADPGIIMELCEHFTYYAPNYKFHPKYKAKLWDGKITMSHRMTGVALAGLAKRIKKFCDNAGYAITFDEQLYYDDVKREDVLGMVTHLNLPDWLEVRDYQIDAVADCLCSRRRTLLSPTSSGKSLMIYFLHAWYDTKTLIIVPSNGLVDQFESDLRSYGYEGGIVTSKGGLTKEIFDEKICISTWQALNNGKSKVTKEWLQQFKCVIGDEAHGAAATCVKYVLESMTHTPYRFGTTGTLNDEPLSLATIEGLFGPQCKTITTRELIDQGYATDLKIKVLVLHYPEDIRKQFHKKVKDAKTGEMRFKTYFEEIDFINAYEPRVKFIRNLSKSLKGNKLVFFKIIDYGNRLYDAMKDDGNVFYIDGGVTNREEIRHAMEDEENATLIGSLGTTSTGISIKRLHHMISAAPMKGSIKLLQSIGRMLRQHATKEKAVMYDIVDDLCLKSTKNFAYQHFENRAEIYDKELFDYDIFKIEM